MGQYQDALTNFDEAYQIADQLKLPDFATEALRNSAEMNFKLGQYETAQSQFLKALSTSQQADDKTMVALESSGIGALYAARGQYDKALKALDAAVKGFQQLNSREWYSVEAMAGYGQLLSVVGLGAEGQKYIDDALKLAAQARVPPLINAEALNCLADSYFYRGDYSSASQQYQRALQAAGKSPNDQTLRAQVGLARTDLEQGRAQPAVMLLQKAMQDATSMGLKALSVQASIFYAQALLATNRADIARKQLGNALAQADGLGMQLELARVHYLLAKAGKPKDAGPHYQVAARILQSLSTQPGASHILDRPDLKAIYNAARSDQVGAT